MTGQPRRIDLNADLGEGFSGDEALLGLVSSASVACGAHAGDRESMLATLRWALEKGVAAGAHPGFADRASFGRREQVRSAREIETLIVTQVRELETLAAGLGERIRFVKPHGALYNQAQAEPAIAAGVVSAVARLGRALVGQPGTLLQQLAEQNGVRFVGEGFPERRYGPDGRLVPRTEPGAVLREPAEIEARALRLAEQGVATLCIHGDDPAAVEKAAHVRAALLRAGYLIQSFA